MTDNDKSLIEQARKQGWQSNGLEEQAETAEGKYAVHLEILRSYRMDEYKNDMI